jgi:hypothetical protein
MKTPLAHPLLKPRSVSDEHEREIFQTRPPGFDH